jgi:hypothetical protein
MRQVKNFFSLFHRWAKANRQLVYQTNKLVTQFRQRLLLSRWRVVRQSESAQEKNERVAIEYYVKSLHSKALASLYRNQVQGGKISQFIKRSTFVKYFKRRWLKKTRARLLFRKVVMKAVEGEETVGKSRQARKLE